ncbi:hypothetical protein TWF694_010123 [Orbilia ellipsospora]|uniref:Uncharacterized protein n=1 Tax=Orbilia ellipsospora TaxID=2528407 RepID=A0AAV9XBK1_9PEZI
MANATWTPNLITHGWKKGGFSVRGGDAIFITICPGEVVHDSVWDVLTPTLRTTLS